MDVSSSEDEDEDNEVDEFHYEMELADNRSDCAGNCFVLRIWSFLADGITMWLNVFFQPQPVVS